MKYGELINETRREIPAFNTRYNKLVKDDIIDKDTGVHVIFSYVFVPLVEESMKKKETSLRKELFDFLEKMAAEKDKGISEVCDFTVMEELCDEFPRETLIPLMGEESKKSLSAVSQYMGRD